MPDREMEGNLLHQYNAAMSFINRNLKSIQVEQNFNSIARLEIPLDVFVEILTNSLIHRDYYQNAPIRLFIFDNRIEIHSPGILPDSVTEESIKQGISKPRNQLLFDNAKYLLPYTGIGSGIVRAMKSYDHITFENNYIKEEFIVTVIRQEILDDYDERKSDYDNDYDERKSDYDMEKSNYDGNYDSNYDAQKSVHDGVYDSVHDEKILTFALIPKSRKEIMDLIGLSTHTDNYEHHIVPLLKKGLLAMTLPDKPKSKNQKYVTTERGEALLKK
jgi:predicted HTH transcriptional regulator